MKITKFALYGMKLQSAVDRYLNLKTIDKKAFEYEVELANEFLRGVTEWTEQQKSM